jgi:hypothetical protein
VQNKLLFSAWPDWFIKYTLNFFVSF